MVFTKRRIRQRSASTVTTANAGEASPTKRYASCPRQSPIHRSISIRCPHSGARCRDAAGGGSDGGGGGGDGDDGGGNSGGDDGGNGGGGNRDSGGEPRRVGGGRGCR